MFILYDTEFTCWEGSMERNWTGKDEHREIIQIGALKINNSFEIIEKLDICIKPSINNQLSEYCKNLTNIEQRNIDNACSFSEGLSIFNKFCESGKIKCWSWGNDMDVVLENVKLNGLLLPFDYETGQNLQDLFKVEKIEYGNINSGGLAKYLGLTIDIDGLTEHDANYDTYSLYLSINKFKENFQKYL